MRFLATYFTVLDFRTVQEIQKHKARMVLKDHGLQQVIPWRPCKSISGDERYGLISHSKYTNPTAIADTTTKCMNILPTSDCCNLSNAGNQRSV